MSPAHFCFNTFMQIYERDSSPIDKAWARGIFFESDSTSAHNGAIVFSVASELHQTFFTNKFQIKVKKWCDEQSICVSEIQSRVKNELLEKQAGPEPEPNPEPQSWSPQPSPRRKSYRRSAILNPDCTFEKFVVGASNELAHGASLMSANSPGVLTNPLFIHGPSGLGKTHLMFSICHQRFQNTPDVRVLYVTGEMFLNDFVEHIRLYKMKEFRKKYRETYDMLLVDDIHTVGRGPKVQEELFNTLNYYFLERKQVVISCDQKPSELRDFAERVRTRLGGGALLEIQWPEYQLRSDFIKEKLGNQIHLLDKSILESLPLKNQLSLRELNGVLNTFKLGFKIGGSTQSLESAERLIAGVESRERSLPHIQEIVSKSFSVPITELISKNRKKKINHARQVFMFIARKCNFSTTDIGRSVCRDHTTVLSGVKRIEKVIAIDAGLRKTIEDLVLRVS